MPKDKHHPKKQADKPAGGVPMTILLVDDSQLTRVLYAAILRRAGYKVVQAHDGFAARRIAEKQGPFDLMITDFEMPGMTGAELAAWFHERWPGMGVLLVSAAEENLVSARRAVRFATCHFKTSYPEVLLAAVAKLLDPDATSGG